MILFELTVIKVNIPRIQKEIVIKTVFFNSRGRKAQWVRKGSSIIIDDLQ